MFRIKKEDYNTVQFLPEYKSTTKAKNSTMKSPPRRHKPKKFALIIFIIIILIAMIAIASTFIYFTYFSASKQFISAINAGDIDKATSICEENSYDSGFIQSIKPYIEKACDDVISSYEKEELSSSEAISKLNQYNRMTSDNFNDYISSKTATITGQEEIENSIEDLKTACQTKDVPKAMLLLNELEKKSEKSKIDIKNDVKSIVKENANIFKIKAYSNLIEASRTRNYDASIKFLTNINQYLEDPDINAVLNQINLAKENKLSGRAFRKDLRDRLKMIEDNQIIKHQ